MKIYTFLSTCLDNIHITVYKGKNIFYDGLKNELFLERDYPMYTKVLEMTVDTWTIDNKGLIINVA